MLVIMMNLYVCYSFFKRIKARQPSSPLAYLASYITLLFYLSFLYVHAGELPANVPIYHLNRLLAYLGSDLALIIFSWAIQKNLIERRNELIKFAAGGIKREQKEDDLFDVRYLPEEYMSDI